jgi:2-oxoisovalerate dehydrogenase E1 component alpha subunit
MASSYTNPGLFRGAEIVDTLAPYNLDKNISEFIKPFPVLQQLSETSALAEGADFFPGMPEEKIFELFKLMVKMQVLDTVLQDIQRQGRISFYISNFGEEAAQIGSISALKFEDEVWTQYRELGCFLYRGLTTDMITEQTFSTKFEPGKGRQMPIHYTMIQGHMQSVTSPLGTKILHAAGAGYAFRLDKADRVAVVYFGDGAASEGDFAVAINFAATLGSQSLFICRNNAYAISTPATDQYKGDGIAPRALSYGMNAIRVDGNDIVAVHNATRAARAEIIESGAPILIELMTYRRGHHSTSDDSTKYRKPGELEEWSKAGREPISRFKKILRERGIMKDDIEDQLRNELRQELIASIKTSEKKLRAPVDDCFTDVYAEMPWHLQEQLNNLKEHLQGYGHNYDLSIYDKK